MASVSFMISVSSSSCSCDCCAAQQAAFTDSFSDSLLGEASSSLARLIDFCFYCFSLVIGSTFIVSGLSMVSIGMFSDAGTLFSP